MMVLGSSSFARIVTVEVTGTVNEVLTANGLSLDSSVNIGSSMVGSCTYDTATPDRFPQFDSEGEYQLISLSMTIGNYMFTNDPMLPEKALFRVGVDGNFGQAAVSLAPRFDGIIYINGSPKTDDEIDLDYFGLCLLSLGGWNRYGITDKLPDSFMDLSLYEDKLFGVSALPDYIAPSFRIVGELTSLTVIPEPATLAFLGLGSLALLRKRQP